ncbi:MAG: hypothetical protein AAFP76_01830 [Bacteroidota bacterium]
MEVFLPFIMIGAVLLIIGISYFFSPKNIILRAMKKVDATSISRVQNDAYVKIIGKAKNVKEPLVAPLSGRPCLFYQVLVLKKRGKNGWDTVIDQTRTQDFFIEVQGEMAMVKMDGSQAFRKIYLDKDHKKTSGTWNDPTPRLEAFLQQNGISSKGFFGFNKTMRYQEGIIELDERIAVKGIGNWKSLGEPIEGFHYSKILSISGNKDRKLLITDLKKATQPKVR